MREAYSLSEKDTPRNLNRVKVHMENDIYFHDEKWNSVCYLASAGTKLCQAVLSLYVDANYRHTFTIDSNNS